MATCPPSPDRDGAPAARRGPGLTGPWIRHILGPGPPSVDREETRMDANKSRGGGAPDRSDADAWALSAALVEAVEAGDASAVADLIRRGADPNYVEDRDDATPLMRAAEAGRIDVVRALVEGGASVSAVAEDLELGRLLGGDEQAAESVGSSAWPLLYAELAGHREVAAFLAPLT